MSAISETVDQNKDLMGEYRGKPTRLGDVPIANVADFIIDGHRPFRFIDFVEGDLSVNEEGLTVYTMRDE